MEIHIPNICLLKLPASTPCSEQTYITKYFTPSRVFVNIPYYKTYKPFEDAICATLVAYDLEPVLVKEEIPGAARICRICRLMLSCKYGITDISYSTHNIPFELGLLLAFGKHTIILYREKHKYQKKFSDLQYRDPLVYEKKPRELIKKLSNSINQEFRGAGGIMRLPKLLFEMYAFWQKLESKHHYNFKMRINILRAVLVKRLKNPEEITIKLSLEVVEGETIYCLGDKGRNFFYK